MAEGRAFTVRARPRGQQRRAGAGAHLGAGALITSADVADGRALSYQTDARFAQLVFVYRVLNSCASFFNSSPLWVALYRATPAQ